MKIIIPEPLALALLCAMAVLLVALFHTHPSEPCRASPGSVEVLFGLCEAR